MQFSDYRSCLLLLLLLDDGLVDTYLRPSMLAPISSSNGSVITRHFSFNAAMAATSAGVESFNDLLAPSEGRDREAERQRERNRESENERAESEKGR